MRRIHLFEVEDFAWFPSSLRDCLTEMLIVVHRLLKTSDDLAPLVERVLRETGEREKGTIDAKPSKKLYLLGVPAST